MNLTTIITLIVQYPFAPPRCFGPLAGIIVLNRKWNCKPLSAAICFGPKSMKVLQIWHGARDSLFYFRRHNFTSKLEPYTRYE